MEKRFHVGPWLADRVLGELTRDGETVRPDARTMRLLLYMASRPGEVISIDEMLNQVWAGVMVTPDSVYQSISELRRLLGDDARQPRYIATVPRQGYRLVAEVRPDATENSGGNVAGPIPRLGQAPRRFNRSAAIGAVVLLSTITPVIWIHATRSLAQVDVQSAKPVQQPQLINGRSIAVLPFIDMTDQMSEEPFADGMVEELISKLAKLPGVAVSPAASTFHYKDRQPSLAEVASALHVAYVLDGSVRKSGNTLRVAARLSRVADGFVLWSETYDRSWGDKLMIQDDIAGEVAKAMATSVR